MLLQRRGVTIVDTADDPAAVAQLHAQAKPGDAEPELIALFVEASDMQLAEVLDDVMAQVSITDNTTRNENVAGPMLSSRLELLAEQYASSAAPRRSRARAAAASRGCGRGGCG